MADYLFQPRGKGFVFRIAVPKGLYGRFLSPAGKPLHRIVEGLATDSLKVAQAKAATRRSHWLAVFERAKQDVPFALAEIADAAKEYYATTLARLASGAAIMAELVGTEREWLSILQATDEKALANLDFAPVRPEIEALQRRYGVEIDPASGTYSTLAKALLRAQIAATTGRMRKLQGQASDQPATFLGEQGIDELTLKPIVLTRPMAIIRGGKGPWSLFEQWIAEAKPAASTVNRWRAVFLALQAKFGSKEISEDAAREWTRGLATDDRAAQTISDVWLSAARRIYKWAVEQKLAPANPFVSIKVTVPDKAVVRDKAFTDDEATKILTSALVIDPGRNTFKAAKRWVPWLCAYSGARAGEITQLRGQDIEKRGDFHTMKLTPEAGTIKTKTFRDVPLHADLIAQGFLDFVNARGKGPLFYNLDNSAAKGEATNPKRPRAVKARERLAAWVREIGVDDPALSPNHAWRHTFKQVAERNGISERVSDTITGHASTTEGRGYGKPTVEDMAEALKKFPRYKV